MTTCFLSSGTVVEITFLRRYSEKHTAEYSYVIAGAHTTSYQTLKFSDAGHTLLRKSKELCESVPGRHFHEKLTELFDEIKQFNLKEHTEKQRLRKYKQMTIKLQKILTYYSRYEECQGVTKYIDFHLESWFTCIKLAGIAPTNNYAEQAIRETVIIRKSSERSARSRNQSLRKTRLTTRHMAIPKLDIKQELQRMLTTNLC